MFFNDSISFSSSSRLLVELEIPEMKRVRTKKKVVTMVELVFTSNSSDEMTRKLKPTYTWSNATQVAVKDETVGDY